MQFNPGAQSRSQTGAPSASRSAGLIENGAPIFNRLQSQAKTVMNEIETTNAMRDAKAQSRSQTGAPAVVPAGALSGAPADAAASRERRRKLEEYLDRGLGECWLRQPAIADLMEGALRFFDGQRYGLAAWVVMPNHVHLLVEIWETPLADLVKSWKGFVAREANKLLRRRGPFWEREYLDTIIADEAHRRTAARYIESNPVKAGLAREAKAWPWSSARFRDEFGRLHCPATESQPSGSAAASDGVPIFNRL